MYFRTNRNNNVQCNIHIDGIPIVEKKSIKFLGITLESTLSWNEHIQNIHSSVSRNVGILYKLKYFLNEKSLFILYNGLILPYISYCNIIWGNFSQTKKKALRIITQSNFRANSEPLFSRFTR